MRTKRITQCCEVSKKRESEATDLLLARFENSFLFELLSLIDNQPNLFSFGQCVQTYNECFASTASGFIQRQLNRQLVYAKNSDILPKSQQVRLPSIRSPCSPTSGLPLWSTCLCWGCMSWTWSRRRRSPTCIVITAVPYAFRRIVRNRTISSFPEVLPYPCSGRTFSVGTASTTIC